MKTLIIDRSKWLRGEHGGDVYLLRPDDGKMCCLGIYTIACGVAEGNVRGRRYPSSLAVPLPDEASWLVDGRPGRTPGGYGDTAAAVALATTNDDSTISDALREKRVAEMFARQGVQVTFVDESPSNTNTPSKDSQ